MFFVDFALINIYLCLRRKRRSRSVDRGHKKLVRELAQLVGVATQAVYALAGSPGLKQYVL